MIRTASVSLVPKEYQAYVADVRETDPKLSQELVSFAAIDHVLDWMKARKSGQWNLDTVSQDEFNYDFLLELETHGRWLSFGVT